MRGRTALVGAVREGDSSRMRAGRWIGVGVIVVLVAGVAYLGAGALAWNASTTVRGNCATVHAAQAPSTFEALYNTDVRLDAAPYRFDVAEDVSFPSRTSAITLRAWWAPPVAPETRSVIVVHGRNSCRHDPAVLLPAGMVHRAGFGVLIVDLRDHGDSDRENGHWAGGVDEWQDVLGAWDWLRAQGAPADSIGALGLSMGAGAVSHALGHEPQLAAAFLDSPYANIVRMSEEVAEDGGDPPWIVPGAMLMAQLITGDDFLGPSPESIFQTALDGRPVDIVHGEDDTTIPVDEGRSLAEAATRGGSPVEPWIVGDADHVEAAFVRPKAYERRVTAFFDANLEPVAP
jgi:dipeptidyl aminopeptidase/acylaminoacyl peptidase